MKKEEINPSDAAKIRDSKASEASEVRLAKSQAIDSALVREAKTHEKAMNRHGSPNQPRKSS